MGNWYTNVSLKGAQQSDVFSLLEELGRRAYVTPESNGWMVVYDEETDRFDLGVLESLALTLSTRLSCLALASFNADDDVLWLALYQNGDRITRYSSALSEFEDAREFPKLGDVAQVLCSVFEKPFAQKQVSRVLRRSHGFLGLLSLFLKIRIAYVMEVERHLDLTNVLDTPHAAVGLGYKYISNGDTPEGMERAALRRTMN